MSPDRQQAFIGRTRATLALIGLFALLVVAKVAYEDVVVRDERLRLADRIIPSLRPEPGAPGPVYTAGGDVLARTVVRYAICANPEALWDSETRLRTAAQLGETTGMPYGRILDRIGEPDRSFAYVARQQPPDVEEQVSRLGLDGVFTQTEIGRVYPYRSLAANAIGLRGVDGNGLCGIELLWGFCLDGQRSSWRSNFDQYGRRILCPGPNNISAQPGGRLVLTLQLPLQQVVEAALDEVMVRNQPESCTCTVLDPNSGNILAISARPNFDPNDATTATPEATRCRPASDVYAPGSTMKTAVIAAALDAGAVTPSTTFRCSGHTVIGDRPLGCWGEHRLRGHGNLMPAGIIANSCNLGAAQIALKLGRRRLNEYLERMHVRETLASGLYGEMSGRLLPEEQQRVRDVANIGFGQGVDLTDLHLVAIYGAIANGGTFHYPNIVREVRGAHGELIRRREPHPGDRLFDAKTCGLMLGFLEGAVEHGTGWAAAIDGVRVGGKTGTAQIWDPRQREFLKDEFIMSFVAIAPVEDPQFVVHVRVTRPKMGAHGSDTALPAAKQVLEAALRLADDMDAPSQDGRV